MKSSGEAPPGFRGLLELFEVESKREAEKRCRSLTVTDDDLVDVILAVEAGMVSPLLHAKHTAEYMHPSLDLTSEDRKALGSNGVGDLTPRAKTAVNKIDQMFKDRRLFVAHLFYEPYRARWHLIHFDQRDQESVGNHWKAGGAHVHYSRHNLANAPLEDVWAGVCKAPPIVPNSLYIRFKSRRHAHVALYLPSEPSER